MITVNLCATFNYKWEKLDPYTPLGLLSLAAVAEAERYKVMIKDPNRGWERMPLSMYLLFHLSLLGQPFPNEVGHSLSCRHPPPY